MSDTNGLFSSDTLHTFPLSKYNSIIKTTTYTPILQLLSKEVFSLRKGNELIKSHKGNRDIFQIIKVLH